ncbi:MAG TPA: copper chaperone, partial [Caldithrix sp.]|nr:copper chaperone [Caldithrix sp.]
TNTVTITTVYKTLGKRALAIYLGSIITISLALGYVLNILALNFHIEMLHHHQHELLPEWLKLLGSVLLLIMFALHYGRNIKNKLTSGGELNSMTAVKTLSVKGMTCMHCQETVRQAVSAVDGVDNVNVDLSGGKVSFIYDSNDLTHIKEAILEKGYEIAEN